MHLIAITSLAALLFGPVPATAQKVITVDPKDLQLSPYMHKELPAALLKRIKATTDTFEKIDGMSYVQAVDL